MDRLTAEQRSALMSRVRRRDTKPEMIVRRLAWAMGFRYRLCVRNLPGTPDLVFANRRKVIFVHGCFWHRHSCGRGTMPSARRKFWRAKLDGNRRRDARNIIALKNDGWSVMVVWECQMKYPHALARQIDRFLSDRASKLRQPGERTSQP